MRLQHRRAAKLAGLPSDASANHSETYDVHDFPSALPSPPSSTRQTPFAVPKVGDSALQDDQNARNDPSGEGVAPTVSGRTLDERTLLDILCFHCDDGLTEDAFDAIMQHAAATAKPGDEFGILFVKRFISDLADTPINQDWLAEIIHRLQQSLDHLCDRAKSQIQSMGKLRLPECVRLEPPVESDAELPDDDEALKGFAKKIGTMSMGETTNDREDVRYQDSTVVSVRSKHLSAKSRAPSEALSQLASNQAQHRSSQSPMIPMRNTSRTMTRQTFSNQEPQRTLSTTCSSAPRPKPTASPPGMTERPSSASTNAFAELGLAWSPSRGRPGSNSFNARPDDVPFVIKGNELLCSQGLHAKLCPRDCEHDRIQCSILVNPARMQNEHFAFWEGDCLGGCSPQLRPPSSLFCLLTVCPRKPHRPYASLHHFHVISLIFLSPKLKS